MIAYDLKCEQDHVFEGWFESSTAFDEQNAQGFVSCPVCGSTSITKALSTFGISRHRAQDLAQDPLTTDEVQQLIVDKFEDVGTEFAKEALKMHYNVTENRNIRGVSTEQEEKMLDEEGISFFKFPMPASTTPDDDDDPQKH
ncbi:MAG: DUF1178 family protein [Deltaproteobacteria bacterium]|nr:DUF1178 family protein [Deltaproteobacteria bacterium]